MILRQLEHYSLAEFFFEEEPEPTPADVIEYLQRPDPLDGTASYPFHTLHLDLTQEEARLAGGLHRETRYELRRAEHSDGLAYWSDASGDRAPLDEFHAFFSRFAAGKGLRELDPGRLQLLAEQGRLDLSRVERDGEVLVWHAHLLGDRRARLLHSASLYREHHDSGVRQLLGRANRWHHWRDLLRLKGRGYPLYDFGGWYAGKTNADLLHINRFKEQFGGTVVVEFNCTRPGTIRGRAVLLARRALRR
jgi:hypothetical protein